MDWKHFWDSKAMAGEGAKQVGRIAGGKELEADVMLAIAKRISEQLQLEDTDRLLDVCCGNAYLSQMLLPYCNSIAGVDFSDKLIREAQKLGSDRMEFYVGDASQFRLNQDFDKVVLYFSFQYFEEYELGKKVIENMLQHAKPGAKILIGDICDRRKFFTYYNSPSKLISWFKQKLKNKNDMGKFWHPKELDKICLELGVTGTCLPQESWQPYAHYRFDYLICNEK
ncbi:MAG: class I SAM-dependent methyltransferase [Bacteroidia bacterium]|nr:class I SAM-dependent methyltransferase [Bacteroidia bacterium]